MKMIIGDKSRFAIESGITNAFQRLSFLALGYFVIYAGGRRYGVYAPNATMLACCYDAVGRRIARRGQHTAQFASEPNAGAIANAYRDAIFDPDQEYECFFGISQPEFRDLIYSNHLALGPECDQAFDDGSYVLQFDLAERIRIIAFKINEQGYHHNPRTLVDLWLASDDFYKLLEDWRNAFHAAWTAAPKISEAEDAAESF